MFANTAHRSWRDYHSGKSSPDSYRYSSSLSSQVALDTPSSEPATPAEGPPLLVLPKRRGHQNAKSNAKPPHIRNKSRDDRSSTSIDLSRSSIELEGLGIFTNLERDTRFQQSRHSVSNLHRSISEISPSSSITRLGQSYVHPRRQLPTPSSPLGMPQRHSVDGGYFSNANRSFTAVVSPTLSVPDDNSDDDNDSNSVEESEARQTTSIEVRRSTPHILQRAQTDTVLTGISSWKESEYLSSTELTSHAAAVQAARAAFAEREASKARKFEEQQKKVLKRDERRHQRSVSQKPRLAADHERQQQRQQSAELHRRTISEAFVHTKHQHHQERFQESYDDIDDDDDDDSNVAEAPMNKTASTTTSQRTTALGPPKIPAATKHNWNKFLTWGKTRYYKAKRKVSMPVSTTYR